MIFACLPCAMTQNRCESHKYLHYSHHSGDTSTEISSQSVEIIDLVSKLEKWHQRHQGNDGGLLSSFGSQAINEILVSGPFAVEPAQKWRAGNSELLIIRLLRNNRAMPGFRPVEVNIIDPIAVRDKASRVPPAIGVP